MNKLVYVLFLLLAGCANRDQAQKYQFLKLETSDLNSKVDLVIKDQIELIDSINKLRDNYINGIIPVNDYTWSITVDNSLGVVQAMYLLKAKLVFVNLSYTILEKANKKFIYLNRGSDKRKYTKLLLDTNSDINKITGGLSASEYITKFLPKEIH